MMYKRVFPVLCFILFLSFFCANAQEAAFKEYMDEIETLKQRQQVLQADYLALRDNVQDLLSQNQKILGEMDSLKVLLNNTNEVQDSVNEQFSEKIVTTNNNLSQTKEDTKKNLHQHLLFLVTGVLLTLLVAVFLYALLRKRMNKGSATIDEIRNVQEKLQEESLKLDNKLLSLFERTTFDTKNEDHSLALKVADEVVRIEMNLYRMDKNVKGYKQLSKAVERIKDNFQAQGYELIDLLGQPYDEGMRINADFVLDEALPEGSRVITSVAKPQINYKGQMIQKATVTVSQNI